nr:hypothetical protein [Tanacetum cinerariifolium]
MADQNGPHTSVCTKSINPSPLSHDHVNGDLVILTNKQDYTSFDLKSNDSNTPSFWGWAMEKLNSLNRDVNDRDVIQNVEESETLNIELGHQVTKLATKNNHLKQTYKQLYDSIKSSYVRSKEQCDDLIKKVNLKSAEVSDLNVRLQEKVLVITALKEQLDKIKGKVVITEAVSLNYINPKLLKVDVTPVVSKLRKNMMAHLDYIKHTQGEAATLRKIVESERLLIPLNTSLDHAYQNGPRTSVCTKSINPSPLSHDHVNGDLVILTNK